MRTLQSPEVQQVSGGQVIVDVDTAQKYVKVTLTTLFGLIKFPIVNVDWSKWSKSGN